LNVRFAIAITGAVVSWWLASRHNVHQLQPLPTFSERLGQVAPALLEGAAGIFFVVWILLLIREYKARSAPKPTTMFPAGGPAQPVEKDRRATARWVFLAIYLVAASIRFSAGYIRFLWPAAPPWIAQSPRIGFDLLTFSGVIFELIFDTKKKKKRPQQPAGSIAPEESWFTGRNMQLLVLIFVGIGLISYVFHEAKIYWPLHVRAILTVSVFLFAVVLALFSRKPQDSEGGIRPIDAMARGSDSEGGTARRRKWWGKAALWLYITIIVLVMAAPVNSTVKTIVFWSGIGLPVVLAMALARLRHWIYQVGHQGEYERALRLNRWFAWIPGYGDSLEGSILFNAGRYREAQSFLRALAFDSAGQPRLTSTYFYSYALALENDGREAEAQKLLEAAVQVPQRTFGLHVALATCLLSQKKDAKRACELMEQAIANEQELASGFRHKADHLRRLGRYAWALAACGRRAEAEAKIQEAFAGAASLKDRDVAGVHYFAGEAWRAMGEWRKARAAFQEAIRLSPEGSVATSVQKALARMREEALT
jgi:tetratricopeptide (TPR) repeat protein